MIVDKSAPIRFLCNPITFSIILSYAVFVSYLKYLLKYPTRSVSLYPTLIILFLLVPASRRIIARLMGHVYSVPKSRWIVILLVTSFTLRAAVLIIYPTVMYSDFAAYHILAKNIADGRGYMLDGRPTAIKPIGYPLFLSFFYYLFGDNWALGRIINVFLSTGIVALTYYLSGRIFDEESARIASLIMVFFPSQIFAVNQTNTEIIYTLLVLISVFYFIRGNPGVKGITVSALFLGFAVITRADAVILFILLLFYRLSSGNGDLRRTLLFILVFSLTITPWIIRNYAVMGAASICTSGGMVLFNSIYRNPDGDFNDGIGADYLFSLKDGEVERDRLGYELSKRIIMESPMDFIKLGFRKISFLFQSDDEFIGYGTITEMENDKKMLTHYSVYDSLAVKNNMYYILVLVSSLMFFLSELTNKSRGEYTVLLLVIWSSLVVFFVFESLGRHHFSLMPLLSIFGGEFLRRLFRAGASRQVTDHV